MVLKENKRIDLSKIIAAPLICSFLMAASPVANAIGFQEDEQDTQKVVEEKRSIKVIKRGDSDRRVVFLGEGSDDKKHARVFRFNGLDGLKFQSKENEKALKEIEKSIEDVTKRLKKTKRKADKSALKAAKSALETARDALKNNGDGLRVFRHGNVAFGREHEEAVREALEGLKEKELELGELKIEIIDELAEVREEVFEAMEDFEFDFDDGDEVRIEIRRNFEGVVEEMEERHLEALKRAEEDLRRERERLEKRLEKRKAEEAEKAAKDDDKK